MAARRPVVLFLLSGLWLICGTSTFAYADSPLLSGPMLASGNHHDVGIWMQTRRPGPVVLTYWMADSPEEKKTVSQASLSANENIVLMTLTGLRAGTRYRYSIIVGSEPIVSEDALAFSTQPLWRRRADPPSFTVTFGSCAYTNDPETDPPGKSYGGGYGIYETIRKQRPDLMLWLGDNVYLRAHDWSSRAGIFERYRRTRSLKPIQRLLASAFHYAIWDDHDFGPNDSNWSYVHKAHALEAFQRYWPNPSYGMPSIPGVFTQFTWGDVDFFLLDNRYHRSASSAPDGPEKTLLGQAQFTWLVDALSGSRAPFKIVAGGGQFLSPFDRWEGYAQFKTEQRRLIDTIVERRIQGVFFLSGDRHHTELVKVQPKGFYPLYDFTSSPLTSRGATASGEWKSPVRVPGTLVTQKRNFGVLKFAGSAKDRVMTMETRDASGALLWTRTVRAQELTLPKVDD